MMKIRTRFAPSPTGYIHLGNVWVAFLNWLWTRQHQGTIVLRMEDIDRQRCHDAYAEALMEDLDWLGIDWDEGPGLYTLMALLYRANAWIFTGLFLSNGKKQGMYIPASVREPDSARLHQLRTPEKKDRGMTAAAGICLRRNGPGKQNSVMAVPDGDGKHLIYRSFLRNAGENAPRRDR